MTKDKLPKDYVIYTGSNYNDVVNGINGKIEYVILPGGDNKITTAKNGGMFVDSLGTGSDSYDVMSLNKGTIINDSGGTSDYLKINNVNIKDFHILADVGNVNMVGYVNSSGISAVKKLKTDSVYHVTKTLKGIIDYNGSMEGVTLITSKGNATGILLSDVNNVSTGLRGEVQTVINYLKTTSGLIYKSALDIMTAKTKGLSSSQKTALKTAQKTLTEVYKTSFIGNSEDNTYTIKSGNHYLGSGTGNDKFTFSGKLGYKDDLNRTVHQTLINSTTLNGQTDNILLKNYSLEQKTLNANFDFTKNQLMLSAFDSDKNGNYITEIGYTNDSLKNKENQLLLKDKKKTYDIVVYDKVCTEEWMSASEKTKNHLAFFDTTEKVTVNSNKGYNLIVSESSAAVDANRGSLTYKYNGGHDIVQSLSAYSNDTYSVDFGANTDVVITDNGGADTLTLMSSTKSKFGVDSLRLMLNVQYNKQTGLYEKGSYSLVDKSNVNKGNIVVQENVFNVKKGLTVEGTMENVKVAKDDINMDNWINYISERVETFLKISGYDSSASVFENGSKQDINSLIEIYNTGYSNILNA